MFLWLLLLLVFAAMAVLMGSHASSDEAGPAAKVGTSKAMEREMAFQARVAFLQKLYAPVNELRLRGDMQGALLKLDELNRAYPGEAHGHILKGQLLQATGALEEAVSSYVRGIQISGDYIDRKNPLSRRDEVERLVDQGQQIIARARANPDNASLAAAAKNVNYLRSRLAGGCE
jgi:cytochrome c-type biogenesis protein CcmH/NrfG